MKYSDVSNVYGGSQYSNFIKQKMMEYLQSGKNLTYNQVRKNKKVKKEYEDLKKIQKKNEKELNKQYDQNLLDSRLKSSYPNNIRKELNLLSIEDDNVKFIGSYNYRAQKYPSDIDGLEIVKGPTRNNVYTKMIRGINNIIDQYNRSKNKFILEVKAGKDERFDIRAADIYADNVIINPYFLDQLNNLYFNDKIIKKDDYEQIIKLLEEKTMLNFEKINKIIRKYNIIRWEPSDIQRGFLFKNGQKVTFKEALSDTGQINIEALSLINGKINDISNFFILVEVDDDGNEKLLNIKIKSDDYATDFKKNLMTAILNVYYSKLDHNPFKALKRLWSFARLKSVNDIKLLRMLEPIISGDVSLASKVKSDIGTIQKTIEHGLDFKFGIDLVVNQIQSIKSNLANSLIFSQDELRELNKYFDVLSLILNYETIEVNKLLLETFGDNFYNEVHDYYDFEGENRILASNYLIDMIKEKLSDRINEHVEKFLIDSGIFNLYDFLKGRYPNYVE